MKKNLFWKFIAVWFMALLTIVILSNSWQYHWYQKLALVRVNKLIGHIDAYSLADGKWINLRIAKSKPTAETEIKTTQELFPGLDKVADALAEDYFKSAPLGGAIGQVIKTKEKKKIPN
jgi:hypothetical protein